MDPKEQQEARSKKYGISVTGKGSVAKPAKYKDVPDGQFADPVNYHYPVDTPERRVSARAYFNHDGQREAGGYSPDDWRKVGEHIIEAAGEGFRYDAKTEKIEREDTKAAMVQGTDTAGGAMVAFRVPQGVAKKMALKMEGALPADDLHATLAYLGPAADIGKRRRRRIRQAVADYAVSRPPLSARTNGTGRFSKETEEGKTPFYANLDSKMLPRFREGLVNALEKAGAPLPSEHGFTPHITLAYLPKGTQSPDVSDVDGLTFDAVSLKFGGDSDYEDFPLTGETKAYDLSARVDAVETAWGRKQRKQHGDEHWDLWYRAKKVLDDALICEKDGKTYRAPYRMTDDGILFGEPQEVITQYLPKNVMGDKPYKAMTDGEVEEAYLKMCVERGDHETRVMTVGKGYVIAEKGGVFKKCNYKTGDDGLEFGEGEEVTASYDVKAGRRMAAPRVSQLKNIRDQLTDAVAKIGQIITWATYASLDDQWGTAQAQPKGLDYLNLDLLAEWMAEAKALDTIDIPPTYLKAVRTTPNGNLVVGGYMVPWGSPLRRDLQFDYATPDTRFFLENYPQAPALFHHGKDPVIGKSVLGRRDDAWKDADGLWVQDWLDKSNKFWGLIAPLLDAKALFYSPGSVPHLVERTESRELKTYPIADDTFTPIPVQAPLLGFDRSIDYIKAVYADAGIEFTVPESLRGKVKETLTGGMNGRTREQQLALALLDLKRKGQEFLT